MDVIFCGIGLTVGFVVCVGSGRFDKGAEVVVLCFVGLWTLVAFCVVLNVDAGRGFVCSVLVAVLDVCADWVVVFGTEVVFVGTVVFVGDVVFVGAVVFGAAVVVFETAVVVVVRLDGFFVVVVLDGVGDGDVNVVSENEKLKLFNSIGT